MPTERLDPRALRDAFGAFMTGVTVVTSRDSDGRPIGFTANSFASVSLSPPLLLVCLAKTSRNYGAITGAAGFAVNILSEGQAEVSNIFAKSVHDRFTSVEWKTGPYGSPVFPAAAAWFDCAMERVIDAGDHTILLGRVEAFQNSGRNGLGYARGGYFTASLESQTQALLAGTAVDVTAVTEQEGHMLLVDDGRGRLRLPGLVVEEGNPAEVLASYLTTLTGRRATVGFLFSVFTERKSGRQCIVYRARIGAGPSAAGILVETDGIPYSRLDSPQTADILRRFVVERSLGNFGIYFGNETAGRVHPLSMGP